MKGVVYHSIKMLHYVKIETNNRKREEKMKKFKLFSVMIAVAVIFGFWGMASAGTLDDIAQR